MPRRTRRTPSIVVSPQRLVFQESNWLRMRWEIKSSIGRGQVQLWHSSDIMERAHFWKLFTQLSLCPSVSVLWYLRMTVLVFLSRTVFVSLPHVLWCLAAKREPYPTITLKKVHYIIDFWTLHVSQKLWRCVDHCGNLAPRTSTGPIFPFGDLRWAMASEGRQCARWEWRSERTGGQLKVVNSPSCAVILVRGQAWCAVRKVTSSWWAVDANVRQYNIDILMVTPASPFC